MSIALTLWITALASGRQKPIRLPVRLAAAAALPSRISLNSR
jgi:hypothetical protein